MFYLARACIILKNISFFSIFMRKFISTFYLVFYQVIERERERKINGTKKRSKPHHFVVTLLKLKDNMLYFHVHLCDNGGH